MKKKNVGKKNDFPPSFDYIKEPGQTFHVYRTERDSVHRFTPPPMITQSRIDGNI